MDTSRLQQNLEQKNAITAENHTFIKEVVNNFYFTNEMLVLIFYSKDRECAVHFAVLMEHCSMSFLKTVQ
jgi:hypothetical protein